MYAGSVAVLTAALAIAPAAASAPGTTAPTGHSARVVVIAVPDLRWADVEAMPNLQAWAGTAAAGELSVRTVSGTARCADGEVTFNAGERADAPSVPGCRVTGAAFRAAHVEARSSDFAADPGALGQALHAAGLRAAVYGDDARALLAEENGHVEESPSFSAALRSSDVVAVTD